MREPLYFQCEVCGTHVLGNEVLAHMESHIAKESVIPDVAGEITGWRAWSVHWNPSTTEIELHSATRRFAWPKKEWAFAACAVASHSTPPAEKCSCGLYAAKTREQLVGMSYHHYTTDDVVIGEVAMSGKVIPGTQGWRAQKARVQKVYVPYTRWRLAEEIAAAYGVPVELDNTLKEDYDDEED